MDPITSSSRHRGGGACGAGSAPIQNRSYASRGVRSKVRITRPNTSPQSDPSAHRIDTHRPVYVSPPVHRGGNARRHPRPQAPGEPRAAPTAGNRGGATTLQHAQSGLPGRLPHGTTQILVLGYLDSNQEQLRAAWPVWAKPRIGGVPRNFRDLMGSSLPRATDSYAVIRADSRLSGRFLVTNLVTGSRCHRAVGRARTRRAVSDLW